MDNIIAVFGGRNNALRFASMLKRHSIPYKVINTPRELSVSCGVSVVFGGIYMGKIKNLIFPLGKFSSVRMYAISGGIQKKYKPI